jgi:general stress protein CsbA
VFAFVYSPQVAVALFLVSIASSILSTFVHSAFFLVPVVLFALNLGACTVHRLSSRLQTQAPRRFGPDLVHLGLLILISGGVLSTIGRQEKLFSLGAGDQAQLDASRTLRLISLGVKRFPDGSSKEWTSTVAVSNGRSVEVVEYPIRVNAPLRLRGLSIYQTSWDTEGIVDLRDAHGGRITATTGQGFREGNTLWYFASVESGQAGLNALFEKWTERSKVGERRVSTGASIGPFTVVGVSVREVSGLKAVHDPGFPVVGAALGVIGFGLALTFIQKGTGLPS